MIGRKDLLAELQAWLDDDTDISGHALVGRAGIGKTRLALEFCRIIDRDPAAKSEWIAGFLSASDLRAVVETLTTHSFVWERRTLWSSTTPPSAIRPWPAGWTGSPTSRMQESAVGTIQFEPLVPCLLNPIHLAGCSMGTAPNCR